MVMVCGQVSCLTAKQHSRIVGAQEGNAGICTAAERGNKGWRYHRHWFGCLQVGTGGDQYEGEHSKILTQRIQRGLFHGCDFRIE
jgi:hypothetical protein